MTIHVIKRDGSRVPLDISKIQRQVKYGCGGIDGVSPSMIELKAQIQFHDGISTKTIDELLLQAMVGLIDEQENPDINNVNYQYVAGRQRVSMLRKEVYGTYYPPKLYDIVKHNSPGCAPGSDGGRGIPLHYALFDHFYDGRSAYYLHCVRNFVCCQGY